MYVIIFCCRVDTELLLSVNTITSIVFARNRRYVVYYVKVRNEIQQRVYSLQWPGWMRNADDAKFEVHHIKLSILGHPTALKIDILASGK